MEIKFRQVEQPEIKSEGAESRKMTFVASDGTRDSAGTVLNVAGWDLKRFNKNGIIGYQHKVYGGWDDTDNPDNIIGKGTAYIKNDKLMVDVEFEPAEINPLAEKVYQKLLFGSLKAVSVGFVPKGQGKWGEGVEAIGGKNPTYYYAGQELLEVSVVNIPANPNALKKNFIEESIEAEVNDLRAENPVDPADPKPEEPKDPDAEEQKRLQEENTRAADLELAKAETIARAALL